MNKHHGYLYLFGVCAFCGLFSVFEIHMHGGLIVSLVALVTLPLAGFYYCRILELQGCGLKPDKALIDMMEHNEKQDKKMRKW